MRVLVTGGAGQLGQALLSTKPSGVQLISLSRTELDLADQTACNRAVQDYKPDWVLNAGAYTAVDQAEGEPELAMAINAGAPAAFAKALYVCGGRLLQLSTDYVFSGCQGSPYRPDQIPNPLGVYGATKAAGESAALQLPAARVLRTSWVYGPIGRNFCRMMLRLHLERSASGRPLGVVADQVGCPTSTHTLAAACWRALGVDADPDGPRVLHWSDSGAATWYDFALAIGELGVEVGLLCQSAEVVPLTTAEYPTLARRPSYSLLDCTDSRRILGLEPENWRTALKTVLRSMSAQADDR
jgi:dTDP-4-dehydrorhamnose reductase